MEHAALARERVSYVLIDSMAMAAQGLPRATRDMDFFVAPERENVERLKVALRSLFDDANIELIDADELPELFPLSSTHRLTGGSRWTSRLGSEKPSRSTISKRKTSSSAGSRRVWRRPGRCGG